MTSIVGARNTRISASKKNRPESKATRKYLQRNNALPSLGYSTYREYLASEDWKVIRKAKMEESPNCECCGKLASCVHHYCYNHSVLLGLYSQLLLSVCNKCHEHIEFDEHGKKCSLWLAQKQLHWMLQGQGRKKRSKGIWWWFNVMRAREKKAKAKSVSRDS